MKTQQIAIALAPLAALAVTSRVTSGQWNPAKTQWWGTSETKSGYWATAGALVVGAVLAGWRKRS